MLFIMFINLKFFYIFPVLIIPTPQSVGTDAFSRTVVTNTTNLIRTFLL